ncbi:hypothetical protein [Actinoplanes subglobosus]|uniref:Uncharacterized protein n=1 Tax=Actinoplanes subglobosus TaxID=1547892 RepID=A0ABV8J463_9ACTN
MDDVLRQIERTYTSLADPQFRAINETMGRQPWARLVAEIGLQFTVEDETDDNNDVAFTYVLGDEGREWVLGLSAVGPYALVGRISPDGGFWSALLEPSSRDLDGHERWLLRTLEKEGLRLLGRAELEKPVALRLAGMEPGRVRFYQALFTRSDILPWDDQTLGRLGLI